MDDIYEDLENYNDVNIIDELRNENKGLKVKLDEYSMAMDKLQKDFDKLSSEYKRLECNYSSLLKTAQAEIERKTEIIKNLNVEKDMLVINSLKNGKRPIYNTRKFGGNRSKLVEDNEKPKYQKMHEKSKLDKKDYTEERLQPAKSSEIIKEDKIEMSHTIVSKIEDSNKTEISHPIISKIKDCNNKEISQTIISKSSTETTESRDGSESKENFKQSEEKDKCRLKPADVKSRRKSVPAERFEENRDNYTNEHERNPAERVSSDKQLCDRSYDKYSKTSDQSYMNKKYRDSRDSRRSRDSKYHDSYKSSDKYDSSRRRRYHSPESRYNRHSREYKDYYRSEYKSRALESPPFDHSDYYRHRDHRVHDRPHSRDYDRYKEDRHAVKHKIPISEYDEPYSKRPRNDTYQSYKRNEEGRRYEKDYLEHKDIVETFEQLESQYTSCQSPDFEHYVNDGESVREIMSTAEVQLEDPRISSNYYKLETVDGKEILSTTIDKNIELKAIDLSNWGLQKYDMPHDLINRPSEEQLIKEIVLNFDNPESSLSIRSQTSENNTGSKSEINQNEENICDTFEKNVLKVDNNNSALQVPIKDTTQHTIYKLQESVHNICVVREPGKSLDMIENIHEIKDDNKNYKEKVKIDEFSIQTSIAKMATETKVDSIKNFGLPHNYMDSCKTFSESTARDIVEGDLELSDETCDNIEYQREILQDKEDTQHTLIENKSSCDKVVTKPMVIDAGDGSFTKTQQKDQTCDLDNTKKKAEKQLRSKKVKRKKHKVSSNNDDTHKTEKNKSVSKPEEIKTKFRDLFGDSTSLITPEDLGIAIGKLQGTNTSNYVPIFEDATDGIELQETTKMTVENSPRIENGKIDKSSIFNNIEIIKNKSEKIIENAITIVSKDKNESKEKINLQPLQNEPDVVKTVVISTGVQPTILATESPEVQPLMILEPDSNTEKNTEKCLGLLLNALATSTPYKSLQTVPDIVPSTTESVVSNNSVTVSNSITETSSNNTMIAQRDVPDVRIFVKRKRKILKRN